MSESDETRGPAESAEQAGALVEDGAAPSAAVAASEASVEAPPTSKIPGGPSVPPPLPAAEQPDPVPVFAQAVRVAGPRALLGPSLWVAGVLLWAYVVMGILTTTRLPFTAHRMPLEEGTAFLLVVAAYTSAGVLAVRRSLAVLDGESGRRAGVIAAGAIGLWLLFVFGAMVLAMLGFPEPLVTFLLIVWSGFAVWLGRRLTNRAALPSPDQNRPVAIGLWIGAVVISLMALLARA